MAGWSYLFSLLVILFSHNMSLAGGIGDGCSIEPSKPSESQCNGELSENPAIEVISGRGPWIKTVKLNGKVVKPAGKRLGEVLSKVGSILSAVDLFRSHRNPYFLSDTPRSEVERWSRLRASHLTGMIREGSQKVKDLSQYNINIVLDDSTVSKPLLSVYHDSLQRNATWVNEVLVQPTKMTRYQALLAVHMNKIAVKTFWQELQDAFGVPLVSQSDEYRRAWMKAMIELATGKSSFADLGLSGCAFILTPTGV
jgi:hypothetical protein